MGFPKREKSVTATKHLSVANSVGDGSGSHRSLVRRLAVLDEALTVRVEGPKMSHDKLQSAPKQTKTVSTSSRNSNMR